MPAIRSQHLLLSAFQVLGFENCGVNFPGNQDRGVKGKWMLFEIQIERQFGEVVQRVGGTGIE